ncbi:MAG: sialidase family protein [Acidobacteriota bacterium]
MSAALLAAPPADAQVTITEINPSRSTLHATDADGASGGRVNGLARATNSIFFAASEWGGVYRSSDAGRTWQRLNGHLPTVTWDIEADPGNPNRVFATSFYDGRLNSVSGINVSNDGGVTWHRPATAVPPVGFCRDAARRDEPSAFGISIDFENPQNVYVGTNCGLAISNDGGVNWRFVDPTPNDGAWDVSDVIVHHGGIIDTCGDDNHRRSTDGGATWTTAGADGTPLNAGLCSLAVSPDEPYVLFATVGRHIFESDDGGGTWNTEFGNRDAPFGGRIPFVTTNKRAGRNFDLWFGDVSLYRAACTTPVNPASGGTARCPASANWTGPFTRSAGAHDDTGDIAFEHVDPIDVPACLRDCSQRRDQCNSDCGQEADSCRSDCAVDRDVCMSEAGQPGKPTKAQCMQMFTRCNAGCTSRLNACRARCTQEFNSCNADCRRPREACPVLLSSDGGVYRNTLTNSPACQTPQWTQPDVTPHGLWLYSFCGADRPKDAVREDLYMGTQDNGTFATASAGSGSPAWDNHDCCDSFDIACAPGQVLYTACCWAGRSRLFLADGGMTGGRRIPLPAGNIRGWIFPDSIDRFGANRYVLLTTDGIFITLNITATPTITWTELGAATTPAGACAVLAAGAAQNPTFFVQADDCSGNGAGTLWRYQGTAADGTWQQVNPPANAGPGAGFGIFAVDRNDPNRLFASLITNAGPQMIRSADGGQNWANDANLDNAMTGNGTFRYRNTRGPTEWTNFAGYVQPTLIAFDPNDPNTIIAGAADSGIFLSRNDGAAWAVVSDNAGTPANPHIPRPRYAYFDRECGHFSIYIGTQGRGAWRLRYPDPNARTEAQCVQECNQDADSCRRECDQDREDCMSKARQPGEPTKAQCMQLFTRCNADCTTRLNACRARCRTCPD